MNDFNETKLYKEINYPVVKLVKTNAKILDVGCSTGALGKFLVAHKNCLVHGIDINAEAIQQARKVLTAAAVMDLVNDSLPFTGELYDILIFGDVLEHLVDPLPVLIRFKQYLKPGGYMIVSLPNIANINIRFKLLFGKWEYKQYGILDSTHLRFFTLKTAKHMFLQAGLKIIEISVASGVFVRNNPVEKILNRIYRLFCLPFPRLFATQFIFKLQPD